MKDLIDIMQKFINLDIKIGFGFEFEFYILNNNQPLVQENFISLIQNFLIHNQFPAIIHKEMEIGQIEIASIMSFDIENTIEKWLNIFEKLKLLFKEQGLQINHLAKPFSEKAGNGMHINISLHDIKTNKNLFGVKDFSNAKHFDQNFYHPDIRNSLLAYSIGGILNAVQNEAIKYLTSDSIVERIGSE
jgi:glutamine synthetase